MATKEQTVIAELKTGYLRGDVRVGVDESHALQARLRLALVQKYHANDVRKDYDLFQQRLAAIGVEESFENPLYIDELLMFLDLFEENHKEVAQHLQQVAPKEMVEMVSGNLAEDARLRRAEIRRQAHELVETYKLKLNEHEKRLLEERVATAISSSAGRAQTPQELRSALQENLSQLLATNQDTRLGFSEKIQRDQYVETSVRQLVDADPVVAQRLLLGNPTNEGVVVERMLALDPPAWRGYVTAIENARIMPGETIQTMIDHAVSLGRTAAFLSTDLAQAPATRATPGAFIEAILQASGNKTALKTFEKLAEQAKNAASLTVVAKAWEDTVDVITKRAGGELAKTLEPIIRGVNKQSMSEPAKHAASLVGDVLNPLLGRTFTNLIELEALNRSLPPGSKILPDKAGALLASPQELFLLAAYTQNPKGVRFEARRVEGSIEPAGWVARWAADSVFGRIADRVVKSEAARGFFGKIIQPILGFFGIRLGAKAVAGAAAGKTAGAAAGAGIRALLARLGGTALGGVVGSVPGLIIGFVGGALIEPALKKGWQLAVNLLSLNFGALGETINAFGGRFSARQRAGAIKKEGEFGWLLGIFVCGAILLPVVWNIGDQMSFQSGQVTSFVEGAENLPDPFVEDGQIYPPPDYIDFSGLASREFSCLSYGDGISTSSGASGSLSTDQKNKMESTIAAYPQIKLLSCSIGCTNPINVTAFSKDGVYAGYAPSGKAGNIVFYPKAFGFQPQSFAKLLAHELAHNIDWRNSGLDSGFYALGCGPTGTYPQGWGETPAETFAEAVGLYMIGWSNMGSYCGGRALNYFNQTLNQCR